MQTHHNQYLLERVRSFFQESHIKVRRKLLLVAVSGGPDSVCLLHVLNELKNELGIEIHVVHLDHKLRGKASTDDAQYVLDLCHKLELPVTLEQHDVKAYQKEHKLSLEEAAREVRYNFFREAADEVGAATVAVGHTLDDHVETVLLNLLRGAGTRGLRGLQLIRSMKVTNGSLTVIRPLLSVSRKATADYCLRNHLKPRTDATNSSMELRRNRVRLDLIPALTTYNPDINEALLRTSKIAAQDFAFLEVSARRYFKKIVRKRGDVISFDKTQLQKLPDSLKRLVIRQAIEDIIGTLKDIEARHIEEMIEFLEKPAGKVIMLPYGLYFTSEYDCFMLGKDIEVPSPFPYFENSFDLGIEASVHVNNWIIKSEIVSPRTVTDNKFVAYFDANTVEKKLMVRTRKPGDRFQPLGMVEEKKVGRFMIDSRIPKRWRDQVPIVSTGDKVIWVVGYRIDDRYKVTEDTKKALRIEFEQK
jgi:tRNA(Ile)-lysidine synthase